MKKLVVIFTFLFFLVPSIAIAKIGVGVGTGKIQVDDKLKPGTIYELPSLTVLNTGDEPSEYEVTVTYHEKQTQLRPLLSWFLFSPQKFRLEPGKIQLVTIKLNLPIRMQPGDYFAYLEAHPVKKSQSGDTAINIAAAVKLYFTSVAANPFQAIYYKGISFWNVYAPWPQRFLIGLGFIIMILVAKKFLHIEINLKKKQQENTKENE